MGTIKSKKVKPPFVNKIVSDPEKVMERRNMKKNNSKKKKK